jgi:hypothetical protein
LFGVDQHPAGFPVGLFYQPHHMLLTSPVGEAVAGARQRPKPAV